MQRMAVSWAKGPLAGATYISAASHFPHHSLADSGARRTAGSHVTSGDRSVLLLLGAWRRSSPPSHVRMIFLTFVGRPNGG